MTGSLLRQLAMARSVGQWLPGYLRARRHRSSAPPRRIWLTIADHFEPWWHEPDEATALARVERWARLWPAIAQRHRDSAGRPACYTFFYPEEQYHGAVMDALAAMHQRGIGDVEVHLHHDGDSEQAFVERVTVFLQRLRHRHDLLHEDENGIRFAFIHGNWALDNSRPDGRYCGLNNEISLLRDLGCYADMTLPSAPSPTQARMVNTIYWATDDPARPKSHDIGVPVTPGKRAVGDLLMIPGPLALNLREWRTPGVPKVEVGELAGNCIPTEHRARLWTSVAPRLGDDVFVKLFTHGAPEKNAVPLLEQGALSRTFEFVSTEAARIGADLYFVSAWDMWRAVDAIRCGADPVETVIAPPLLPRREAVAL